MDPSPVLSVQAISKRFGGVQALNNVSMEFMPGKVHCLAGENGSGKSTLIKVTSGVEVPDVGTITLGGRPHRALTPRAAIKGGVQIIYQDLSMFSNLTVAENIAIAPMIASGRAVFRGREAKTIANDAMARINVNLPLDTRVGDVSIAQRQITAICRALAQDARILFMDEPTTALTRREVDSLFRTVDLLREQGVAIVFVSHKFNEVLSISDEITVLRNGSVVASGPSTDFDRASLSTAMTGHEVTRLQRRSRSTIDSATVLKAEGMSVDGVLEPLSLELHEGEILGITGLMGSGRDAVAEALFGITPATSGVVSLNGKPCAIRSVNDAIEHGIGYVPGDRLTEGLFLDHSVAQNVVAASTGEIPRRGGLVLKGAVVGMAQRMIAAFGIKTSSPAAAVRTLSGGNQQRVVLAKWFIRQPRVLMLNGPTVGVDIGSKREIMSLLQTLSADGTAIIVISDDVSELVEVCHRVLVMRHGAIASELVGEDLNEDRITRELVA